MRAGVPARFHHISHGTLGIVAALAAVGAATGRRDLSDLALAGAGGARPRRVVPDRGMHASVEPH